MFDYIFMCDKGRDIVTGNKVIDEYSNNNDVKLLSYRRDNRIILLTREGYRHNIHNVSLDDFMHIIGVLEIYNTDYSNYSSKLVRRIYQDEPYHP